jgi:hypothetical protein
VRSGSIDGGWRLKRTVIGAAAVRAAAATFSFGLSGERAAMARAAAPKPWPGGVSETSVQFVSARWVLRAQRSVASPSTPAASAAFG